MNSGRTVRLGDLCEISTTLIDPRTVYARRLPHVGGANIETCNGRLIDLKTAEEEGLKSGKFLFDNKAVLYSKIRPYLQKVARPDFVGLCSADIYPLTPNEVHLDRNYLFYLLLAPQFTEYAILGSARAGMPKVNRDHLFAFELDLPSLGAQQRIAGVLDEAFAGISAARTNAERNLSSALSLFGSHLESIISKRGNGWVTRPIADCFQVKSGDFLPARAMVEDGEFDVYGGNGIIGKHDAGNLSGENIVIGRVGAKCGNVRYVRGGLWLTDNAFFISRFLRRFHLSFLARLLDFKDLRSTANQAAQPVISYATIKSVVLEFPENEAEQESIALELDTLYAHSQHLTSIYRQKLALLKALEKSLLHRAFTGQL